MLRTLLISAAFLAFLCTPVSGQLIGGEWKTLRNHDGHSEFFWTGLEVEGVGDLDSDGTADYIVGSPLAGLTYSGIAEVFSGRTGALLYSLSESGAMGFGWSTSKLGDVDGDGVEDFLIGAPFTNSVGGSLQIGRAFVYSGATGTLLRYHSGTAEGDVLGSTVGRLDDLNWDGVDDYFVSGYSIVYRNSIYIHSGATGNVLWSITGTDELGRSAVSLDDIDGDGATDLAIGSPQHWNISSGAHGGIRVHSGATGQVLYELGSFLSGRPYATHLGYCLSQTDDLDMDGFDDFLAGAPDLYYGSSGSIVKFSSATGAIIDQFHGVGADRIGFSIDSIADMNGDGIAEIVTGWAQNSSQPELGHVAVLCGDAGQVLWNRSESGSVLPNSYFGWSVSGAGDLDGDGTSEFLIGEAFAEPGGVYAAGTAHVISLDPFLKLDSNTVSASGSTTQLSIDFPTTETSEAYIVLASLTGIGPTSLGGIEIPLTSDLAFQRTLSRNTAGVLLGGFGVLDANGDASASLLGGPALSPFIGSRLFLSAASFDSQTQTGRMTSVARWLDVVP